MTETTPPKLSVARRLLLNLATLAGGTVVALALAEGLLRAFHLAPTNGVFTVTEKEFRRVPGMYGPGQDLIETHLRALPHHVTIDSLGYRGADFPREKPAHEVRVLFLGDSFAYGDLVDNEKTLPAQLETMLHSRCSNVRVINGGLHGTTVTDQIKLARRALTLKPDFVLLMFYENDVNDIAQSGQWGQLAANRAAKSRFPLSWLYPILRRTALWNFALVSVMVHKSQSRQQVFVHDVAPINATAAQNRLRAIYLDTLRQFRAEMAAASIPMLLLTYPADQTLFHGSQADWLIPEAQRLGIATLDGREPLVASKLSVKDLYLLPYDRHASPAGYRIMAQFLADRLPHYLPQLNHCSTAETAHNQ